MDCFFYYNLTTYNYVENGLYSRDTILYDFFSLSGYIGNESNIDNIDIITSFRGNESAIPNDIENFSFKCDTTLILKRFENVYYIDEGPTFFFSPNTGVVGFYDGNKLWEINQLTQANRLYSMCPACSEILLYSPKFSQRRVLPSPPHTFATFFPTTLHPSLQHGNSSDRVA